MLSTAQVVSSTAFHTGQSTLTEYVAYVARVSNPANQHNNATAERLIRYLIRHKHWSPFEMAHIGLSIKTTRDIARQLLRHRSFSFQEFSQRYAVADDLSAVRPARLQDPHNRQNSYPVQDNPALSDTWREMQEQVAHTAIKVYGDALAMGIAKEVARAVLPEGLTVSHLFVSGSLRSWMHYVEVRTHPDTQQEHRQLAHACAAAIVPVFPFITDFVSPHT